MLSFAERREVKRSALTLAPIALICPFCEVGELYPSSYNLTCCQSCGGRLHRLMLEILGHLATLPDTLRSHGCKCGHPEMRRLPDGVFHCPSRGSEVLPIDAHVTPSGSDEHGAAWRTGWMDGRFGERGTSFVDNPNLAKWEIPSERLDYYRGHCAGSEARLDRSGPLLARTRKVET
jgi:hypothetical protein